MPWVLGIDEAGYGPNLGPFVMASVCCRVPDEHMQTNLWRLLKKVVRRHKQRDDGRLLIEDSKVVYSPAKGLKQLERGVLAAVFASPQALSASKGDSIPFLALRAQETSLTFDVNHLIEQIAATAHPNLREECWFHGKTQLPVQADHDELLHVGGRFVKSCTALSLQWAASRCAIVCPERFNRILDRGGSKGVVLMLAFTELLQHHAQRNGDGETVKVFVDKHGGRNHYGTVLQQAFPDGHVHPELESAERSVYRVCLPERELHVHFEPRADANHFTVALASMLAKYIRELLMLEFNAFWRQHLPDLAPTAGYPGDAARFMDAIRPVAAKLGITETALWRRK